MIHIKKDRCGYKGYKCVGIGELSSVFNTDIVADLDVDKRNRTSDFPTGAGDNYINNYLNLPARVKGSVMALPKIHQMTATSAPEEDCTTNLDPFSGGVLDLYNVYKAMLDYNVTNYSDFGYIYKDILLDFTDAEAVMTPGMLEPILDTTFNPVSMLGPSATDLALDGLLMGLERLAQSNKVLSMHVNRTIRNGQDNRSRIKTLQDPSNSSSATGTCIQFQITLSSGKSVIKPTEQYPMYNVSGGYASINNQPFTVQGLTNLNPPFTVWAVVQGEARNGIFWPTGVTLTTQAPSNMAAFMIGSVTIETYTPDQGSNIPAKLYFKTHQERCSLDEFVYPFQGTGVVYSNEGALELLPTAPCNTPSNTSTPSQNNSDA